MKRLLCAIALCFCGAAAAAEPLAAEARAALEKATAYIRSISTEGGYLWYYSLDLKERAGEEKATATQIWVQPPGGTSAMGMVFLRAYEATGDARYLDAARAAANALVTGQLESGGWDYVVEFDPALSTHWHRRSDVGKITPAEAMKRRNLSTYDDDNTQSALRLLIAVADATKGGTDPRDAGIRQARDYGLKKLLAAQRPSGGWPQRWNGVPPNPADWPVLRASVAPMQPYARVDYPDYYTLNDNAQRNNILTLIDAYRKLGVREYLDGASRGGDFLLLAQLPEPHPVWAQQYNRRMEPVWARPFEPPAVVSAESGAVMRVLIDVYTATGDRKYLEPLPRAAAWFGRSEVEPGKWARFYELGTNKPIYAENGKIHYMGAEVVGAERQMSYAFRGNFNIAVVLRLVNEAMTLDREKVAERRYPKPSAGGLVARSKSLEARVRTIVGALDREGRWVTDVKGKPTISIEAFVANANVLSDYLEGAK